MSTKSSNTLNTSLLSKKVNYIGKKLLENNFNHKTSKSFFSVIIISDTHSEQFCENKKKPSNLDQYCLLLRKIKLIDDICCVVHGGDAIKGFTKKSNTQLTYFITSTKIELYENANSQKIIPFIMNIGNHEYSYNNTSDIFNELVGGNSDLVKIKGRGFGIILLETGYSHNGFPNITAFKKQISNIERKIKKESKKVGFLLDMHVPPQLGEFSKYSKHTLNTELTNEFVRFLNKYQSRIIAVSSHHIHNFRSEDSSKPVYIHSVGNIPIYLTSSGGNKDSNKHCKNEYKCLKMNFYNNGHTVELSSVEEIKL